MSEKWWWWCFTKVFRFIVTVWALVNSNWMGIAAHKFCYLSFFFLAVKPAAVNL